MENAYRPEAWHDLYVMLGGAAAALAGLLFVAISIHLNEITKVPYLRIFARNTMIAMFVAVVRAAVILVPQGNALLAAELTFLNLFGFVLPSIVVLRHRKTAPRGRILRAIGIGITDVIGMIGAISLVVGVGGGMYLVTAAHLVFLGLVVSSSWMMMIGISQAGHRSK